MLLCTYTTVQTVGGFGFDFLFGFWEEKVTYAHQSYLYLIKNSNTGKKFKYPFSILIYFLQPFLQS